MRIDQLLAAGPTRSFEFFPPKSDEELATLNATLHDLEKLSPSFVSVTYRGGRESRQRTFDLVTDIQRDGHLVSMAHLICVGHRREEMREILENYQSAGVVNVMALGGDIPDDPDLVASDFTPRHRPGGAGARSRRFLHWCGGAPPRASSISGSRAAIDATLRRNLSGPISR